MRKALFWVVAGVLAALPSASMENGRPHQRCMPAAVAPEDPSLNLRRDTYTRGGCRGVWRFNYCSPIDNGLC